MTVRPFIQMGNTTLRGWCPQYNTFYRDAAKWVERNISLNLPRDLIHTVDKIIYLFDLLLPSILEIAAVVIAGFALDLTLASMAPGLIPVAAFCLYDVFSQKLYPYDYLRDLNQASLRGELANIVPTQETLRTRIGAHLCMRNHVMLVGPAGCGKTSTVFSLAQFLESDACPPALQGKRIYHLDLDSLMNDPYNALHRILILVNELNAGTNPDAVIFIDEAHRMNDRVNGLKLSDFLKPFLEIRHLHVIGATTKDECEELFKDKAIARRFEKLTMGLEHQDVQEPENDDAPLPVFMNIIRAKFQSSPLSPTDEAIVRAIKQAEILLPSYALPDSAIKVIRATIAMKVYNQDCSEVTSENINQAITDCFVEYIAPPKPSPEERVAIVLESWIARHNALSC